MTTLYITHPSSYEHVNPPGHPERTDRLRAIEAVLEDEKFQPLARVQAPDVPLETIALCHPMEYVEEVRDASPKDGWVRLDADTTMSPGTFEAAVRAVGGAVYAIDEVLGKRATNAFCALRPPGHHAETVRPMGFCIFNQAAIAARHAQRKHGVGRIAVVDFDVHHGNGTQEIFWSDPALMYCSTHEMPLYPGTGAEGERGDHDNIVNAPLRAGDGGDKFKAAMDRRILPRLKAFAPELIIISAGFDAHMRDPLANLQFTEADFGWATRAIMDVADQTAQGRVISVLEGGYDLEGLSKSVAAHVIALMRG
ncbi:MAG: histone deacetylase family protein [Alphaproteobacteria bacterium]|nr:histone deacetylase family protein [Alphaproteobacteria bacterium]